MRLYGIHMVKPNMRTDKTTTSFRFLSSNAHPSIYRLIALRPHMTGWDEDNSHRTDEDPSTRKV